MSDTTNEVLTNWAVELVEDLQGHPSGAAVTLRNAIKKGDLEELRRLCAHYSNMLAIEEFHNRDIQV